MAVGEQFEQLLDEFRQGLGIASGEHRAVKHHRLFQPAAAGALDRLAHTLRRRQRPSGQLARLRQQAHPLIDGGDGLAGIKEVADDTLGVGIERQLGQAALAARQQQSVKVSAEDFADGKINGKEVTPALAVPAVRQPLIRGDGLHRRPGLEQRPLRLGQLCFLKS